MITNAILNIFYYVIDLILTPIKSATAVTANSSFVSAVTSANEYINNINNFFPVYTLITVILLIIAIELAIVTYNGIMWAVKIVRGSG